MTQEIDTTALNYGGHVFEVMCSRCLAEPFDAEDECPELDEVVAEGDEEP